MYMKPILAILLIAATLCAGGCGYQCETPGIYGTFSGYDSTELAIVIVRTYERSTPKFSKLLSTQIGGSSIGANVPGTDTVYMGYAGNLAFYPKRDYDYTIEIPATGQLFKLRDFSVEQERDNSISMGGERDKCSNTITYYLDDVAYSDKGATGSGSSYVGSVMVELKK